MPPVKRIEFRPLKNSDDEDGEEVELLSRGSGGNALKRRSPTVAGVNSPFNTPPTQTKFFVEHKLQPDDTVLSLSLRYSVTVRWLSDFSFVNYYLAYTFF